MYKMPEGKKKRSSLKTILLALKKTAKSSTEAEDMTKKGQKQATKSVCGKAQSWWRP